MTAGSKGDDAPGDGGRGSGAQPQASGRVVVRSEDTAPGDRGDREPDADA